MKTRIIDSEKREAFEQSWKRDQYRHPQGDIAKFNACFFANDFVSELEGENGASLNVERCFLDFDQCSGCGHHQDCALRRLRISIINAIDFSTKHYRKQFKKGGGRLTRLETTTRLCELVAEIEEIRSNTKGSWFVYGELQEVGAKVQGILQRIQEEGGKNE